MDKASENAHTPAAMRGRCCMRDPFAARAELGDLRYEADCERPLLPDERRLPDR